MIFEGNFEDVTCDDQNPLQLVNGALSLMFREAKFSLEASSMIQRAWKLDPRMRQLELLQQYTFLRALRIHPNSNRIHLLTALLYVAVHGNDVRAKEFLKHITNNASDTHLQVLVQECLDRRRNAACIIQNAWKQYRKCDLALFQMSLMVATAEARYNAHNLTQRKRIKKRNHDLNCLEDYLLTTFLFKQDFKRSDAVLQECLSQYPEHPPFHFIAAILAEILNEDSLGAIERGFQLDNSGQTMDCLYTRHFKSSIQFHCDCPELVCVTHLASSLLELLIFQNPVTALDHIKMALESDPISQIAFDIYLRKFATTAFSKLLADKNTLMEKKIHVKIDKKSKRISVMESILELHRLQSFKKDQELSQLSELTSQIHSEQEELLNMQQEDLLLQGRMRLKERMMKEAVLTQGQIAQRRKQQRFNKRKNL